VRYSKLGWLGSFPAPEAYPRGATVLLRTPRGLELGEILVPALATGTVPSAPPRTAPPLGGSILRRATPEDLHAAQEADQTVQRLLPLFEADAPPWLIVDAEATLDHCCILHTLPAPAQVERDPAAWTAAWQEQTGWRFEVLDLARFSPPLAPSRTAARRPAPVSTPSTSGCSSGGCSNGGSNGCSNGCSNGGGCSNGCSNGGGCSNGSCGRGTLSTEELYAYFALLREHYPEHLSRYSLL
jgi:uncharacterized membrane protein YgcG